MFFNIIFYILFLILIHAQEYETTVVRIGQKKPYIFQTCTKLIFLTAYKRIKIKIMNTTNIKSILFSDTNFQSDCQVDDILYQQCVSTGTLCSHFKNVTQSLEYQTGFCAERVYLYIQTDATQDEVETKKASKIYLQSSYLNESCNSIAQNSYVKCGKYDSHTCSTTCIQHCVYIKCHQKSYEKQRFGLCLPSNLTSQEYLDRCQSESDINTFTIVDKCKKSLSQMIPNRDDNPLFTILIIVVVLFLISIIYYRYKLKKYNTTPFTPPSFCPSWIYPKKQNPLVQNE